jgi:tetratricopeptide (TPR) repeat protein
MIATSLRRPELLQQPLLPEEEKRLNKAHTIQHIKKAGLIICLFLFPLICSAQREPTDWLTQPKLAAAYTHALNLEVEEARKIISTQNSSEHNYIASLSDILELLLTEDEVAFERYEDAYERRLSNLEKIEPTAASLFVLAELRLQWAFVYLKFGHEVDAAWNIRQAYLLVQQCKKKFPSFIPIKKTSGVLEVMLGSVPDKYQWVISLFGMSGSVDKGLNDLREVQEQSESLMLESSLLLYLIQGYILQETELAVQGLTDNLNHFPSNRLLLFFGASLAIKNSQSEKALSLLHKLEENKTGLPFTYSDYQFGEVYLHKGDYSNAIKHYQKFLNQYRGLNYVKDAHYKIGICFWLDGYLTEANTWFNKAKQEGKEATEADKYAARSLAETTLPNIKLSKIRYATDGGYYQEAKTLALTVSDNDLKSAKDKIEFVYRKARLYDKSGETEEAINFYIKTITQQGLENWYFAPNSCLQLGYILLNQKKVNDARRYFEKALSYKKHEYKNSIDSKAKSALAQMKKQK